MRSEKSARSRTATALMMLTIAAAFAWPQIAGAETVLRIGMTAADIPRTLGQPDQGFEGNRFTGVTMYDALTMWDLSSAEKAICTGRKPTASVVDVPSERSITAIS